MASWTFNPSTKTTDDEAGAIIPRIRVEEAIGRLAQAGIRNRYELVRILGALSSLGRGEIRFNVDLVLADDATRVRQGFDEGA